MKRIRYFTKDKIALISEDNKRKYEKYLQSNIIRNRDVKDTTYKVYKNNMEHFMVYLAENWDNIDLYSKEFEEEAVYIMKDTLTFYRAFFTITRKQLTIKSLLCRASFYGV